MLTECDALKSMADLVRRTKVCNRIYRGFQIVGFIDNRKPRVIQRPRDSNSTFSRIIVIIRIDRRLSEVQEGIQGPRTRSPSVRSGRFIVTGSIAGLLFPGHRIARGSVHF